MASVETSKKKPFDFTERSFLFGKEVQDFLRGIPQNIANVEYEKQLIRSSGSVGANYIEANEALSKRDRIMHMRISRKEAKESRHWLRLLDLQENKELEARRKELMDETMELVRILSTMIDNSQ